jgi:hypothetical protein
MNAFMLWSKEKRAGLMAKGFSLKEVGQVILTSYLHLFNIYFQVYYNIQ